MLKIAILVLFIQAALTSWVVEARKEPLQYLSGIPDQLDWRLKGVVSPVKNQGAFGSSLIIAFVEMIESEIAVRVGILNVLSVQQIVDCCPSCNGGGLDSIQHIANYIRGNGLERASDYPSHPGDNSSCDYKTNLVVRGTRIAHFRFVMKGNETDLKVTCALRGPVFVVIDVEKSLELYRAGIYYDKNCDPDKLNHSMLVVGYGSEGGEDYWVVKNSWGVEWGEEGYVRMSRNKNDNCGIADLGIGAII